MFWEANMSSPFTFIAILTLLASLPLTASSPTDTIHASALSSPVTIDGQLDDACWQRPADLEDFLTTFSPAFGNPLPGKTQLWLAYDKDNLYFAIRAHDPEAQLIKTSLTRRDSIGSDDWVAISIDALGGRQNAYEFMVNPSGIQGDLHITSTGSDPSPDYVWHSAARRNETGYDVEIQIPLRNIRFQSGHNVTINLMLKRHLARSGAKACWPPKSPSDSFLAMHHPVFYEELKKVNTTEVIPSVTYGALCGRLNADSWSQPDGQAEIGITSTIGISSSIRAEATINPDFSQVESDQLQVLVNQRYPLFFEEKRPFFMETGNFFNLAASDNSGDYNMFTAVHTRNIVAPKWGLKLTGEAGPAAFGFLAARDEWHTQSNDSKNTYILGRLKWNLGSDNYAGILYSARSGKDSQNSVLALDISTKLFSGKHHLNAKAIVSSNNPMQTGSTEDTAFTASWGYYTKPLSAFLVYEHAGENFHMNSAFMLRSGISRIMGYLSPSLYPQNHWLKRLNFMLWAYQVHDYNTKANDSLCFIAVRAFFSKQANIRIDWRRYSESWMGQQLNGSYIYAGGQVQLSRHVFFVASLESGDKIRYDATAPLSGSGLSTQMMTWIQPSENTSVELSYTYEKLTHPSNKKLLYDVNVFSIKNTYQINRFLFLRAIVQYDSSQKVILSDFLASFTLIPETVIHVGFGAVHEKMTWGETGWETGMSSDPFIKYRQSFFFKASYRIQI